MSENPLVSKLSRRGWLKTAGLAIAGGALLKPAPARAQTVPAPRMPELSRINLAGNENPFGPSQEVLMTIVREAPNVARYPFREETVLKEMIAEREGVTPEHIVLGNGCDEILSMAGLELVPAGTQVVATRPTYLQLMDYAERHGAEAVWVDHEKATMRHDFEGMLAAITPKTSLVYVCNPDTPTGTMRTPPEVESFIRRATERCSVFLDEVYLDLLDDFAEHTQVGLVREGLPVVIGRSFSKMHGLAGLRIGYAVTTPELAERLKKATMSSLNYLGVYAAMTSLRNPRFHAFSRQRIRQGRERFTALLDELSLDYTPSVGNFVFHKTGIPIREFQDIMRERNFLIGRPFPPYEDWVRISIGTPEEMSAYEIAMREVFAK